MYASPIVIRDKRNQLIKQVGISYKDEVDLIKAEARLSKKAIVFR